MTCHGELCDDTCTWNPDFKPLRDHDYRCHKKPTEIYIKGYC